MDLNFIPLYVYRTDIRKRKKRNAFDIWNYAYIYTHSQKQILICKYQQQQGNNTYKQ